SRRPICGCFASEATKILRCHIACFQRQYRCSYHLWPRRLHEEEQNGLEALRPLLTRVEYRNDFNAVAADSVRNHVACARHDQLACVSHSTRSTKIGELC